MLCNGLIFYDYIKFQGFLIRSKKTYRITSCNSKLIDLDLPKLSGSVAQLDRATAF